MKGDRAARRARARRRVLGSFTRRVIRVGFRNTRVEDVCREAGISNRDFYSWFGNKDGCYLAVFDAVGRKLLEGGRRAFDAAPGPWETKLRAGLDSVACRLGTHPRVVRFLMEHEAVDGGASAVWRLIAGAEQVYLTEELRHGSMGMPAATLEAIVTSVVVYPMVGYVESGRLDRLPELVPWIVHYSTRHLFGPERAARLAPVATGRLGAG